MLDMTCRSDSMYKSHDVIYRMIFCKNDFATSEIVRNISKIRLHFMVTYESSKYRVNINFARIVSKKIPFQKQFYRIRSKNDSNLDSERVLIF